MLNIPHYRLLYSNGKPSCNLVGDQGFVFAFGEIARKQSGLQAVAIVRILPYDFKPSVVVAGYDEEVNAIIVGR